MEQNFVSSSAPAFIHNCVVVYRLLRAFNATFEITRKYSPPNRSIRNTMHSTLTFLCSIKSQVKVKIGRCGDRIRCNFVKFKSQLPATLAGLRTKMFSTFIFFNEVSDSQRCSSSTVDRHEFLFLAVLFRHRFSLATAESPFVID